jgi:hypothetical protein
MPLVMLLGHENDEDIVISLREAKVSELVNVDPMHPPLLQVVLNLSMRHLNATVLEQGFGGSVETDLLESLLIVDYTLQDVPHLVQNRGGDVREPFHGPLNVRLLLGVRKLGFNLPSDATHKALDNWSKDTRTVSGVENSLITWLGGWLSST